MKNKAPSADRACIVLNLMRPFMRRVAANSVAMGGKAGARGVDGKVSSKDSNQGDLMCFLPMQYNCIHTCPHLSAMHELCARQNFNSGCPSSEIGWQFQFKRLMIGMSFYFGADLTTILKTQMAHV
jgi:hypothetical protein